MLSLIFQNLKRSRDSEHIFFGSNRNNYMHALVLLYINQLGLLRERKKVTRPEK